MHKLRARASIVYTQIQRVCVYVGVRVLEQMRHVRAQHEPQLSNNGWFYGIDYDNVTHGPQPRLSSEPTLTPEDYIVYVILFGDWGIL